MSKGDILVVSKYWQHYCQAPQGRGVRGWWRLVSRWAGGGWLAGPRHLCRHTRGCLVTGTTRGQILTTKRDEDDGLTIDESF